MTASNRRVLVTDFDGTITGRDFYKIVVERHLPAGSPDFWAEYKADRITHFEALNGFFGAAEADEAALVRAYLDMGVDPDLKAEVEALAEAGWDVVVASAGCAWYIDRLLDDAGVRLTVHANPGRVEGGRLVMRLPEGSPFFCKEMGVDKPAVVRHAQANAPAVAFAGDSHPDLAPALLVPPELRFATGQLAEELDRRGEAYRSFTRWSEVARALREDPRD